MDGPPAVQFFDIKGWSPVEIRVVVLGCAEFITEAMEG